MIDKRDKPTSPRKVHGGHGPGEGRGMRPTNQGPRPTVPPPKPSDSKK